MPEVDFELKPYKDMKPTWEMTRDVLNGEKKIKEEGEKYLPKLGGQDTDDYRAYKNRGTFYNAFSKTVSGFVGTIMRKTPDLHMPESMKEEMESVTSKGQSLTDVISLSVNNVLSYGRMGVLVDKADVKSNPNFAIYLALDIINWRTVIDDGDEKLVLLVLREKAYDSTSSDMFKIEEVEVIRVLYIEEESGKLVVQLYKKQKTSTTSSDWIEYGEPSFPMINGKRLDFIPFVFFGSTSNSSEVENPPLIDLLNINMAHWRTSVDEAHGLHFAAMPTPWAAGFEDSSLYIGPTHAWVSSDPQARCGYLEFSGQGLSAIANKIEKMESQMAALGARLIDKQRKGIEAAETARLRQIAEMSSLTTIANTVSSAMTLTLRLYSIWKGSEDNDISCQLNTDFIETQISPQTITALLQSLQAGKISHDTFLWNLQMGEVLPQDRTPEEEKDMIDTEGQDDFQDFEEEEEEIDEEEEE